MNNRSARSFAITFLAEYASDISRVQISTPQVDPTDAAVSLEQGTARLSPMSL